MKKIFISVFFIFICKLFFGQPYPVNQNLGRSTSTLVRTNSIAADQGVILGSFPDTANANLLPYLKNYPFTMIATTSDSCVWIRSYNANRWQKVALGGGGTDTIIVNGSFWGLDGNSFFGSDLSEPSIGIVDSPGDAFGLWFKTMGTKRAYIPPTGFALSNDTTQNKIFTINPTTGYWGYANWVQGGGGGGGGTPAGSNTQVQINSSGAFGAVSGFTMASNNLSIPAGGAYKIGTYNVVRMPDPVNLIGTVIVGNGAASINNTGGGFNGQYNSVFGWGSGTNLNHGNLNTLLGVQTGYNLTDGIRNTFIGHNNGFNATTADYNYNGGYNGLNACTTCGFNTGIGSSNTLNLQDGFGNTTAGVNGLHEAIHGDYNAGLGLDNLWHLIVGSNNTALGTKALRNITYGSNNIAIGFDNQVIPANKSNQGNIGHSLSFNNIDGHDSTITGNTIWGINLVPDSITSFLDLPASITGRSSLRLRPGVTPTSPNNGDVWVTGSGIFTRIAGVTKQLNDQTGPSGSFIANDVILQTSANYNIDGNGTLGGNLVATGYLTGNGYTLRGSTANGNLQIVNSNTANAGTNNTAFGKSAGLSQNGSSANNSLFGLGAGSAVTSGSNINAYGVNAGNLLTSAADVTAIGSFAASNQTNPTDLTAIGKNSVKNGTLNHGTYTTAIGSNVLAAGGGDMNTAVGAYSYYQTTDGGGGHNVGIGGFTGSNNTTGNWNIYIGDYANGVSNTASGQLNIGGFIIGTGGNQTASAYSTVASGAKVAIGTNTLDSSLNVGSLKITGGIPGVGKVLVSDATGGASWQTVSASTVPLSSLTPALAPNTILNGNNNQVWTWDNLKGNVGFTIQSSGDSATSNLQEAFRVFTSGTNVNSNQTTWGIKALANHTGTNSTNVALHAEASNGTNNYAIVVPATGGNVGVGTITPATRLHVVGSTRFDLGSDATGDIFYRNSSGNFTRLGVGSSGQVLTVSGGLPSWASATSTTSPRNLKTDFTDVGNVGTGEDNLITYSIPAGTLANNGDYLEFTMTFIFGESSNAKQVRCYFGSTVFYASGSYTQNNGSMEVSGKIVRTGATTQSITFNQANNTVLFTDYGDYVPASETLSGAITIKATGEATANDDIVQKLLIVKYVPGN